MSNLLHCARATVVWPWCSFIHVWSGLLRCPLYPRTNFYMYSKVSEDPLVKVETKMETNRMKTTLRSLVRQEFPWSKSSGNKGRNFKQSWPPVMWMWCFTSWRGNYVTEICNSRLFGWLKFCKSMSICYIRQTFLGAKLSLCTIYELLDLTVATLSRPRVDKYLTMIAAF